MNSSDKPDPDPAPEPCPAADPLFDGHLERPLLEMTVQERLDWIDDMMRFRHWVRTELRRSGPDDSTSHPSGRPTRQ